MWELAKALQNQGQDVRVASVEPVLVWPLCRLRGTVEVALSKIPEYDPLIRYRLNNFHAMQACYICINAGAMYLPIKSKPRPGWYPQIVHSHALIPEH